MICKCWWIRWICLLKKCAYTVTFGSPRDEILTTAKDIQADLIVIGSRRPNISTHLLGSLRPQALFVSADISVLVVR